MPPYLDPVNQAFIDAGAKAGGPPLYELSYVDARAALEGIQAREPSTDVVSTEFDVETSASPTGKVTTVLYRPAGSEGKFLPTIFYTHGGGWILGSPNTHDRLVRDLVRATGYAIVFPYYTPAPDTHFPVQYEQGYAVILYIAAHGTSLGLKTDKFAIAGDSVGGQMALAMCALTAARGGPDIIYQVLFYPVTSTNAESSTWKTYVDGPYLSAPLLHWMYAAFYGDHDKTPNSDLSQSPARKTNLGSALMSTTEELKKLPPTIIFTAGVDPLQAEGEEFGHKLQQVGVPVAIFRCDGQLHDFAMLNPISTSPTTVAAIELAGLKLKQALA